MGLITCPECKREVSEYADSCPQCGFPIKSSQYNSLNNKNDIPSRLDNILSMRSILSKEIVGMVNAINNLMNCECDITDSYRIKVNEGQVIIQKYSKICENLEQIANDIETITLEERYTNYFKYLINNIDNYCGIINSARDNSGYDTRIHAFLFCYSTENFNQNVIYHIKHPFLTFWQIHHSCRQIKNFNSNVILFKILKLVFYIFFISA